MSLTVLNVPGKPEEFNSFIYNIPKLKEQQVIISFTDLNNCTRIERIFDVNKHGDGRITYNKQIHDYHHKYFDMVTRIEHAERANKRQEEELFDAIRNQYSYTVRGILKTHISPDCKNYNGWTPLMLAAYYGEIKTVEFVLQAGADINAQDQKEWTAIMFAARHGKGYALDKLLQAGANPNLQNDKGWTALMMAARYGYYHTVSNLIDAGADRSLKNKDGQTAEDLAKKYRKEGHSHCTDSCIHDVNKLLELFKSDIDDDKPLLDIIRSGDTHALKDLLDNGMDPNKRNDIGWTPLILAAMYHQTDILKCLLDAGANPNIKSGLEWDPLITAARHGHIDIVEILISAGADINSQNFYGWTSLVTAAQHGHFDVVKTLLDAGANPKILTKNNRTALDFAKTYKHTEIVKLLSGV